MAATAEQPRAAVVPVRNACHFELVMVVRHLKPAGVVECLDCGGGLCSSGWRSRWSPCPWWERFAMRFLPKRYRWQRYRVERA